MNAYNQNNESGFTLVEVLVAIAIFVSSITAISAIFAYSSKSQRTTEAISEVQSDARFAMEVMAQSIRRGSIDYASSQYEGSIDSNPQAVLVLRDNANNQIWFKRAISGSTGVVQMSETGEDGEWFDITPSDVDIDLLKFYLSPLTDPFSANPSINIQPKVTIVMTTSSATDVGEHLLPTFLQTTVSSRQYVR